MGDSGVQEVWVRTEDGEEIGVRGNSLFSRENGEEGVLITSQES